MPTKTNPLISLVDKRLDSTHFREQHWEGSLWEFLDIVVEHPTVARNALQRVYDERLKLSMGAEIPKGCSLNALVY